MPLAVFVIERSEISNMERFFALLRMTKLRFVIGEFCSH